LYGNWREWARVARELCGHGLYKSKEKKVQST
jgi:hypothetical protein